MGRSYRAASVASSSQASSASSRHRDRQNASTSRCSSSVARPRPPDVQRPASARPSRSIQKKEDCSRSAIPRPPDVPRTASARPIRPVDKQLNSEVRKALTSRATAQQVVTCGTSPAKTHSEIAHGHSAPVLWPAQKAWHSRANEAEESSSAPLRRQSQRELASMTHAPGTNIAVGAKRSLTFVSIEPVLATLRSEVSAILKEAASQNGLKETEFVTLMNRVLMDRVRASIEARLSTNVNASLHLKPVLDGAVACFSLATAGTSGKSGSKPSAAAQILHHIFEALDVNRNGYLEQSECSQVLDMILSSDPGPAMLDLFFRVVDKKREGILHIDNALSMTDMGLNFLACCMKQFAFVAETIINSQPFLTLMEHVVATLPFACIDSDKDDNISQKEWDRFVEHGSNLAVMKGALGSQFAPSDETINGFRLISKYFGIVQSTLLFKIGGRLADLFGGVSEEMFCNRVVPLVAKYLCKKYSSAHFEKLILSQECPLRDLLRDTPLDIGRNVKGVFQSEEVCGCYTQAQNILIEVVPEISRALFRFIDINGNGNVTKKEFELIRNYADTMLSWDQADVADVKPLKKLFAALDRDGSGKLTRTELAEFALRFIKLACSGWRVGAEVISKFVLNPTFKESFKRLWEALMPVDTIQREDVFYFMELCASYATCLLLYVTQQHGAL